MPLKRPAPPLPGNAQNTLAQPTVWLTIVLTTVVCIMPVVAFRFLRLNLKPDLSDTVRGQAVCCGGRRWRVQTLLQFPLSVWVVVPVPAQSPVLWVPSPR